MGIIPGPTEYGFDCLECFDTGKTPKFLKAFFSGISIGEFWVPELGMPPNGYVDMQQDPSNPCRWGANEPPYPCAFYRAAPLARLIIWGTSTPAAFWSVGGPPYCARCFTNYHDTWKDNYFYGGYGVVLTSEIMADFIETVTPMIDPNPRMECFPIADKQIVLRYAGKRDATKIYIKVDTDP